MKIQSINLSNSLNLSNFCSTNKTSFKGLWGDSHTENYDDRYYSETTTYESYYPFKDESKEEIDKVVKKHSSYSSESSNATIDPVTYISTTIVSVMATLPFTAQEFQDYLYDKISEAKSKLIEKHINGKKLHL